MKLKIRILIYPFLMLMVVIISSGTFRNNMTKNTETNNNPTPATGTVTDKEGNIYKTVTLGKQIWMAENLKTTKYRNGDPIPAVTVNSNWAALTTGGFCWYNNDAAANKATYGALYNWYAVNDLRNIAPSGWHVPSDEEWTVLANFLAGKSQAGGKLKETSTSHWSDPNSGATNSSGFTALPGGYRNKDGVFKNLSFCGTWWATTEYTKSVAWYRYVDYGTSTIYNVSTYKTSGFSIRCIKD
ncbi:MAG: hypothetical protein C0397_04670 [Odoribacter sp.]|nr:hypothetical protein [Odoribacter sp.]